MKTTKDSETMAVEDPIIDELQKEIIKNLISRYGGAEVVRKDIDAIYNIVLEKVCTINDSKMDDLRHGIEVGICPNQILSNSSIDYCEFLCQLLHSINGIDFIAYKINNNEVTHLDLFTRKEFNHNVTNLLKDETIWEI